MGKPSFLLVESNGYFHFVCSVTGRRAACILASVGWLVSLVTSAVRIAQCTGHVVNGLVGTKSCVLKFRLLCLLCRSFQW
ncbi:Potassium-transporting ATPase ATP-binding subunit [Trichinella pseudospiralis]